MVTGAALVAAVIGLLLLMQVGSRWCRKVVAGAGLVAAGAGTWSLVQESGRWCRKVVRRAVSEGTRFDFWNYT